MKKIINGKAYNTETAKHLATFSHGRISDFDSVYEELYQTKNGTFFLHYEGGPKSKYSEVVGQNEWSGGEGLRLVDEDEAKAFIEKYGDVETYLEVFGEVEEG